MKKEFAVILFCLSLLFGVMIGIQTTPFASATNYSNYTICQDVTPISSVPCAVVTPVLNCLNTTNSTYIYNLTNLTGENNTQLIINGTLDPNGDGTYSFLFNYSQFGNYGIVLCDNDSSTITVGTIIESIISFLDKYLLLIVIPLVLLIIGLVFGIPIFPMIAGILFAVDGVYYYLHPFALSSLVNGAIDILLLAFGLFLIGKMAIIFMEDVD